MKRGLAHRWDPTAERVVQRLLPGPEGLAAIHWAALEPLLPPADDPQVTADAARINRMWWMREALDACEMKPPPDALRPRGMHPDEPELRAARIAWYERQYREHLALAAATPMPKRRRRLGRRPGRCVLCGRKGIAVRNVCRGCYDRELYLVEKHGRCSICAEPVEHGLCNRCHPLAGRRRRWSKKKT